MTVFSRKQVASWNGSLGPKHFTLWDGAIRSGKTVISLVAFLEWLPTAPRGPVAIIGKTQTTIARNILSVIGQIDPGAIGTYSLSSDHVTVMGRRVWIIGANDAQAESKIRGLTLAGAYVDEITLMPEAAWVQLLGRLSLKGARLFGTTNPDSSAHWLKTKFIDRIPRPDNTVEQIQARGVAANDILHDWGFWHFTMDDNPGLSPEYVAAKKREFTGLFYRRFVEGLWVNAEGAVYDTWDPDTMVISWDKLPRIERIFALAADYGTQHATSGINLGLGEDGVLYALDEWRLDATNRGHSTWTDAQQSKALLQWIRTTEHAPGVDLQPERIIVDPAAASFRVQLDRDGAWNLTPAENDVLYGIRLVSNGLNAGWLRITDHCQGLINEIPGYSWDPKAALAGEDKPIKVNDDSCDALRYAVTTTERAWRSTVDRTALLLARKEAA